MNKSLKVVINIFLALGILASLIWAWALYIFDCTWGHSGTAPACTIFSPELSIGNSFFWIFLLVIPIVLVCIVVVLNRKRRTWFSSLAHISDIWYNLICYRRDSSVVEHFHGKEGVLGSNPSRGSTSKSVPTNLKGSQINGEPFRLVSIVSPYANQTGVWFARSANKHYKNLWKYLQKALSGLWCNEDALGSL